MKISIYFIAIVFLTTALLLTSSCKKEKLIDNHTDFLGTWIQLTDENIYHKLDIRNNSKGTYYECTKGASGDCADTQFRKWRIKNNNLYYGTTKDLGEIMEYPTVATFDIPVGNSDTIKTGTKYMILNVHMIA